MNSLLVFLTSREFQRSGSYHGLSDDRAIKQFASLRGHLMNRWLPKSSAIRRLFRICRHPTPRESVERYQIGGLVGLFGVFRVRWGRLVEPGQKMKTALKNQVGRKRVEAQPA